MAGNGLELPRPVDLDHQVQLGLVTPHKGGSELRVQLLGDRLRNGPGQDREVENFCSGKGCIGGTAMIWMASHSPLVKDQQCIDAGGPLQNVIDKLLQGHLC
jgi:hypothetical protein